MYQQNKTSFNTEILYLSTGTDKPRHRPDKTECGI